MKKPARYHHGDLYNACVTEAARQVERGGADSVSLREVARRLGVSPRAPYRHFPDKLTLLAAAAERGFERFAAVLSQALERPSSSPRARLRLLADAYIGFSLAHPHLVQLMFSDSFPDRARRFPSLHARALRSFALLETEVGRWLPGRPQREKALSATVAWALVHGLADLLRRQQLAHVLPSASARRAVTAFAVELFLRGLIPGRERGILA